VCVCVEEREREHTLKALRVSWHDTSSGP
jgi:hypothetical protein